MSWKNLISIPKLERWNYKPGYLDRINLRMVFDTDDDLGIPMLAGTDQVPAALYPYNLTAPDDRPAHSAFHFFLDDYRFEVTFARPEYTLGKVQRMGMALTPDFSLWPEMPRVMQMWQLYRNRWVGAWWEDNGITVIPTMGWSDWRSYEWAFRGVPKGSVVAVSTRGVVLSADAQRGFMPGFEAMLDAIEPAKVLVHGRPLDAMLELVECVNYPAKVVFSGRKGHQGEPAVNP